MMRILSALDIVLFIRQMAVLLHRVFYVRLINMAPQNRCRFETSTGLCDFDL